jgi:F-type H+-transporting ATPase subunit epsilon
MKLGVYTIEKTLFEGEVEEVIAKTTTGEISILPNHIPLITRLTNGPLKIKLPHAHVSGVDVEKEKTLDIPSGFLEVQPESSVVVLVDTV